MVLERKPMPVSRSTSLLAWIAARPGRAFAAFLALHAAVWTALPALLYPNLPLDLIEALVYGREWQLGYDKLPPLPWWLVQIAFMTVGHDFAYYLLAQIAVVAGFAFVYLAARPLVGTLGALACVLIIDGLHYLNYTSAKFNHDVVQLPFWALAGFAFHRALRGRQNADWLLLGLAVGLSLWAKYFVAGAGGAARAVRLHRSRRAQDARHARTLYRDRRRARHHGAASGLAGEERFPAVRLCRAPRRTVARLVRSSLAPAAIRGQPIVLFDSRLADRGAAVLSARGGKRSAGRGKRRRLRPPHRHAARLRSDGDGAGAVGRRAAAAPWRCGAIRSGCSSVCGS